jgi:diadenylate cyclase
MGIVVRGDRIIAAGVQFPLAEGEDISQELGSRHRAAVGLSQEADCLVLVVSEETGAISLAERGQLLRKLSVEGLRAVLRKGLSQAGPPPTESNGSDNNGALSELPGPRPPSRSGAEEGEEEPPLAGKTAA